VGSGERTADAAEIDTVTAKKYVEARAFVAQVGLVGVPSECERLGGSLRSGGVAPGRWSPRGKRLESLKGAVAPVGE